MYEILRCDWYALVLICIVAVIGCLLCIHGAIVAATVAATIAPTVATTIAATIAPCIHYVSFFCRIGPTDSILTDFQNSFSGTFRCKFGTKVTIVNTATTQSQAHRYITLFLDINIPQPTI